MAENTTGSNRYASPYPDLPQIPANYSQELYQRFRSVLLDQLSSLGSQVDTISRTTPESTGTLTAAPAPDFVTPVSAYGVTLIQLTCAESCDWFEIVFAESSIRPDSPIFSARNGDFLIPKVEDFYVWGRTVREQSDGTKRYSGWTSFGEVTDPEESLEEIFNYTMVIDNGSANPYFSTIGNDATALVEDNTVIPGVHHWLYPNNANPGQKRYRVLVDSAQYGARVFGKVRLDDQAWAGFIFAAGVGCEDGDDTGEEYYVVVFQYYAANDFRGVIYHRETGGTLTELYKSDNMVSIVNLSNLYMNVVIDFNNGIFNMYADYNNDGLTYGGGTHVITDQAVSQITLDSDRTVVGLFGLVSAVAGDRPRWCNYLRWFKRTSPNTPTGIDPGYPTDVLDYISDGHTVTDSADKTYGMTYAAIDNSDVQVIVDGWPLSYLNAEYVVSNDPNQITLDADVPLEVGSKIEIRYLREKGNAEL